MRSFDMEEPKLTVFSPVNSTVTSGLILAEVAPEASTKANSLTKISWSSCVLVFFFFSYLCKQLKDQNKIQRRQPPLPLLI